MLIAFCATLLPLPIVPSSYSKEGDEAFPCQDSPCGCRTAHQCWTSCCCTTPAERLAWAKRHGVTPPAYAKQVLQASAAVAVKPVAAAAKTAKNCCAKKETRSCCQAKATSREAAAPKRGPRRFVIGALVLGCQGKASAMTSLPWAIVPVPPSVQVSLLPIAFDWPSEDLRPIVVAHTPPLPPPRVLSAI
ncbi:MAG: hypothetical protein ACTHK7_16815 [Aureliella sp.]